jgi:hypothetical protein
MTGNGNGNDEDRWLEALAGRGRLEDDTEQALIDALGRSLRETAHEEAQLAALLRRLDEEQESGHGGADVHELRPRERPDRRTPRRWVAMAASVLVLAGAAVVVQQMYQSLAVPPWVSPGAVRAEAPEPLRILVDDPRTASDDLTSKLGELGIEVERYRYRGRWIVDFTVLALDVPAVDALLRPYGTGVPPDGRVLLAFSRK